MDLFGSGRQADGTQPSGDVPLAERMRPLSAGEIVGQDALLAEGSPLRDAITQDRLHSMIFWGPPGSGKTTLARLIARLTRARFVAFSAVMSGIREIREVMNGARRYRQMDGSRTILFIDEIHRFNKAQQDAFLPHVEIGTIILVGATTENPSFEVNAALLSRCAVYVLNPLADADIVVLRRRAVVDPRGLAGSRLVISDADCAYLASRSGGDARRALNVLELIATFAPADARGHRVVARGIIDRAMQRAPLLYDKAGENHFNLISTLHKSLRNSDADAAVYWLVRLLESGEDPLYAARRMIRFASEDIGNADPRALSLALAARDAFSVLGMPEGALALAQAATYLAAAPKSNAVYTAYERVLDDLRSGQVDPVPMAVRNAPTGLMRQLGYGRGYRYAHDEEDGTADLGCLPDRLRNRRYYVPRPSGYEATMAARLKELAERRERQRARGKGRAAEEEAKSRRDSTPTSE
jgi:putative ATPase